MVAQIENEEKEEAADRPESRLEKGTVSEVLLRVLQDVVAKPVQ